MKKLILLVALFASVFTFAQTETTESKFSPYIAGGISIGNDNGTDLTFSEMSCASIEVGVMYENLSFALVTGLNSFSTADQIGEYFYEGKVVASKSLGYVDGFVLAGVGSFFGRGDIFIEYGVGLSKEFEGFGTFVQVSNWNGTMYVTPGISFSL